LGEILYYTSLQTKYLTDAVAVFAAYTLFTTDSALDMWRSSEYLTRKIHLKPLSKMERFWGDAKIRDIIFH
jgi:hypothetical protein